VIDRSLLPTISTVLVTNPKRSHNIIGACYWLLIPRIIDPKVLHPNPKLTDSCLSLPRKLFNFCLCFQRYQITAIVFLLLVRPGWFDGYLLTSLSYQDYGEAQEPVWALLAFSLDGSSWRAYARDTRVFSEPHLGSVLIREVMELLRCKVPNAYNAASGCKWRSQYGRCQW